MGVSKLGYVVLQVADLAAWKELTAHVFGFEVNDEGHNAVVCRLDERYCRYRLQQGSEDKLLAIGWEMADFRAFETLVEVLRAQNSNIEIASRQECAERHVAGLARFADPSNFPCEIFYGAEILHTPLRTSRETTGFKTGDLGLGHIVLAANDPLQSVRFYRNTLGFKLSDTVTLGALTLYFLRCNPRHHSIAFSEMRPGLPLRLSHVMVEVNSLEDVGKAYDICLKEKLPMQLSLGQHTNDHVVSFYVKSPSGFAFEYGFGGIEIDDHCWEIVHWKSGSSWGHHLGG